MSTVIELTFHGYVDPNKLKELVIDFIKLAPPIFKSFNVKYLPSEKNTGITKMNGLDQFDESSRAFGCTTCFMEEEEADRVLLKPDFILKTAANIQEDSYHTDIGRNKTCYLDCDNDSSDVLKGMDKSEISLKKASLEVTSLMTSCVSMKLNVGEESKCFKEKVASNFEESCNSLTSHSIALQNDGASFNSKKSPQVTPGFIIEQQISSFNPSPEDDVKSNEAIDDSSFDRSSLYRLEEEFEEEYEENEPSKSPDPFVKPGSSKDSIHADNLVDVLAAAKRGDLAINEEGADVSFASVSDHLEENVSQSKNETVNVRAKLRRKAGQLHGVTCSVCTRTRKRFTSIEQVVTHLLGSHGKELPKPFKCAKCRFASSYRANVGQHLRNVHRVTEINWNQKKIYHKQEWHPTTLRKIRDLAKSYFPCCVDRVEKYLIQRVQFGFVDIKALEKDPL